MSDYVQRYLDAVLPPVQARLGGSEPRFIGNIENTSARVPHLCGVFELGGTYFSTTLGNSALPAPTGVGEGFEYFELCAFSGTDSPRLLWLLSNVATWMLSALSPMFYGSGEEALRAMTAGAHGELPRPKPFLPYQTLRLGGDDSRMLLVPRLTVEVELGPQVDVVEPLPITNRQWDEELADLSPEERAGWVERLGPRSLRQWEPLLATP